MNGLKSGKDRTEPWVLFACALERTADTDSHRELSRLPFHLHEPFLRVRDRTLCDLSIANLRDLVTLVTANSDLTSLQTPLNPVILRGPLIKGR